MIASLGPSILKQLSYKYTNDASQDDKDMIYAHLQLVIDKTTRRDRKLLIHVEHINAKIGSMLNEKDGTVEKHDIQSERNDNSEKIRNMQTENSRN